MSGKTSKRPSTPKTTVGAPRVLFTAAAFQQYFRHGADATLRGEEYRCEIYGTVEEQGLLVRYVLDHATRPAMRLATMTDLRQQHLVLLGESRKLAGSDWTPDDHAGPYVFLLGRRLDGHLTLTCHSGTDRVTTHDLGVVPDEEVPPVPTTRHARPHRGGSHAR